MSQIDENSGASVATVTPIAAAKGKPAADGSDLPFIRFSGGMVYLKTTKLDKDGNESHSMLVVCKSHLRVVGTGWHRGEAFRVLELGKEKRRVKMPTSLIGDRKGWAFLQGHDVQLTQTSEAKRWLGEYLLSDRAYDQHGKECGVLPVWVVADKPGWLDSGAYLLPSGEIIGDAGNAVVELEPSEYADAGVCGTVDSWVKNVGAMLRGNDTALLAVGASLASVLIGVLGVPGFGVHLYGQSSGGKTSSCYPAMSVLGSPESRLATWRSTPLALTLLARCCNDALVTLDEVKLIEAKHIESAIYSVFSQKSKLQGAKDGPMREGFSWRNVVLSTGELAVDAFVRVKTGRDIDAGALVRLVQVRHRPFGNLHGFANGSAFADHLRAASCENFGAVGRWWIECLVKNKDEVRADFAKIKERWNGRGGHGQRQRVAEYFAVIEAALTLPSKTLNFDVGECQSVLDSFYAEWVDDFSNGGNGSHEEALLVERLEAVLSQHGRFLSRTANDQDYNHSGELWGYFHEYGDVMEYLVFPAVFKERICGTIDATVAAKLLHERGMLRRQGNLKTSTVVANVRGKKSGLRFYALSLPVVDDLDEEEAL